MRGLEGPSKIRVLCLHFTDDHSVTRWLSALLSGVTLLEGLASSHYKTCLVQQATPRMWTDASGMPDGCTYSVLIARLHRQHSWSLQNTHSISHIQHTSVDDCACTWQHYNEEQLQTLLTKGTHPRTCPLRVKPLEYIQAGSHSVRSLLDLALPLWCAPGLQHCCKCVILGLESWQWVGVIVITIRLTVPATAAHKEKAKQTAHSHSFTFTSVQRLASWRLAQAQQSVPA